MKKKFALVVLAAAAVAGVFVLRMSRRPAAAGSFDSRRDTGPTLVIDAGHGGQDGGAVSISGVSESVLNLAVARRLDAILGFCGVPSVMLRTEDVMLSDPGGKTMRERKVSDLHNRVKLVNREENAVLISIHQNSFTDGKYSGAQVFYAPTTDSQGFAERTQELLRVTLSPENDRKAKPIPGTVYLMNHIGCKAILVECGFLTNRSEDQLLQTPEYQLKLAAVLAGAYLRETQAEPQIGTEPVKAGAYTGKNRFPWQI